MILAGEAVGRLGVTHGLPLPYRGQEPPSLPDGSDLEQLPVGPCRGYALRRCMTRSVTEGVPLRHAGLGLDAYVQFTSPIRRYSDVMAHFNIKAHLRGEPLPFPAPAIVAISAAATEATRELARAEAEVTKYWAAEFMRQHRAEGWAGLVLGWFKQDCQLAAVSLEALGLEVIVKVDFPVYPGERLLLRVSEVDVRKSHFRMYVADRLGDDGEESGGGGGCWQQEEEDQEGRQGGEPLDLVPEGTDQGEEKGEDEEAEEEEEEEVAMGEALHTAAGAAALVPLMDAAPALAEQKEEELGYSSCSGAGRIIVAATHATTMSAQETSSSSSDSDSCYGDVPPAVRPPGGGGTNSEEVCSEEVGGPAAAATDCSAAPSCVM